MGKTSWQGSCQGQDTFVRKQTDNKYHKAHRNLQCITAIEEGVGWQPSLSHTSRGHPGLKRW